MPFAFTKTDYGQGNAQTLPLGQAAAAVPEARPPAPWGYRPPWQRGGGGPQRSAAPPLVFKPMEQLDVNQILRERFQLTSDDEEEEDEGEEELEPPGHDSDEDAKDTRFKSTLVELAENPNDETKGEFKKMLFKGYSPPHTDDENA